MYVRVLDTRGVCVGVWACHVATCAACAIAARRVRHGVGPMGARPQDAIETTVCVWHVRGACQTHTLIHTQVMRDLNDNVVIVCSIENVDPMGVHTGATTRVCMRVFHTIVSRVYARTGHRRGSQHVCSCRDWPCAVWGRFGPRVAPPCARALVDNVCVCVCV
jgi:hypothetical protein